jgi:menaquinone-dependent protoporphyrinogen oxidase
MVTAQLTPLRVLIVYGTNEGQTARIAQYLARVVRGRGCIATSVDLRSVPVPRLESYDAVIVGASLHAGKYQKQVRRFVRQYRTVLERLPSAFFSVSLTALDPTEAGREGVQRCLDEFSQETGWRPARVASFAGALPYTRYRFFTRWMMKAIVRSKGSRDLDTSRNYEYTDWNSVERFAEEFLETLEAAESPDVCSCACSSM